MSIRVMSRVWDDSHASGTSLLLLLAIADVVDDNGTGYVGQATLARKARVSDRTVRRVVDELVELGEVEVVQRGGRAGDRAFASVYRVRLETLDANRTTCPVGASQPDIAAVPTGQIGHPNRTPVSTLPSVTTSVYLHDDDDARVREATEPSPVSLRATVAAEAPTNVKAKITAIEKRVAADGFTTLQAQLVGQALMDDEAGTVALAEHSLAASKPAGFFLSALRRGQHVGFSQRAAQPKQKRPGDEAAERFVARALAARERQAQR